MPGGNLSHIVSARTPQGRRVVVKADDAGAQAMRCEAEWLRRHAHAPDVLDLDDATGVLVLEQLDATSMHLLDIRTLELAREHAWLCAAAAAAPPARFAPTDVRARYAWVAADVAARAAARPWDIAGMNRWLAWAATLDSVNWRAIPLDVIMKNTLVDPVGQWWAIDPLCALGPPELVWCPWAVDRSLKLTKAFGTDPLRTQEALLETSPDPAASGDWMPGALVWTLSWCPPERDLHRTVLDLVDVWLDRWRQRHR